MPIEMPGHHLEPYPLELTSRLRQAYRGESVH